MLFKDTKSLLSNDAKDELPANKILEPVDTVPQPSIKPKNPVAPSADQVKAQALQSKMISAVFGEMVTLLMRSEQYKHYSLSDLEWLIIPPLLNNQFMILEARKKSSSIQSGDADQAQPIGPSVPIGLALWANVSPEVDQKLSENLQQPIRLRPDEWKSGEIPWLIEMVGNAQAVKLLFDKLQKEVFISKGFKMRTPGQDGKVAVKLISKQG